MKDLYLIGGGGHCRSCIDVIEMEGKFQIKGIFDIQENVGKTVLGYPIIASDDEIGKFINDSNYFLITIGQIKTSEMRVRFYNQLKELNAKFATVISPRAYVSKHARVGEGTIVLHDVLVNANAEVGKNCILNTKCLIEHDVEVGDHCHISTASVVNGGCVVKMSSFIGSNAVLRQGLIVHEGTLIQAGSFYRGE